MTASLADPVTNQHRDPVPGEGEDSAAAFLPAMEDPFVSSPDGPAASRDSHRYSSFDTQLLSLDASSPSQAKRALEAHLAETERRLQEASKLGTALVEQQQKLTEKLREVERQQDEGEIGPELRRKLMELEREYNEIGKESARAFLAPKRLVSTGDGTPSGELRVWLLSLARLHGDRIANGSSQSPTNSSVFTSQATASPSKVSVPSRKQRNQQSSRVHDIEFATEISTSLLAQVRQLQALLAERDEALKQANLENSRLELEAEGFAQRIRALDESEQRYKDENWNLETQTHELMNTIKEATDRENRLNNTISTLTAEKNSIERELEELKQANSKLLEDQAAAQKALDSEIHMLRRNLSNGDAERQTLQAKVDELTSQNQELVKAVSALRARQQEVEAPRIQTIDPEDNIPDQPTPENTPPPSPNKPTPRHGHLETETLRSSLGHAHRMIQNLKSTIHREKTEKIELKRMLQEARDELETRRREAAVPAANHHPKRQKIKQETFKKPIVRPDLLGPARRGRTTTEVALDEPDWEDHTSEASPTRTIRSAKESSPRRSTDLSEAYQTATEADDSFETANERETATESEAFQTGVESMAEDSGDDDDLTETEERAISHEGTPRARRVPSSLQSGAGDRTSYHSTASTSEDEAEEARTPVQSPPQRYRLRMNRGAFRRIRPSGEAPMAEPMSPRETPASPTQGRALPMGQSLFAELEELGSGNEGDFGTPVRSSSHGFSQPSTPLQNSVVLDRRDSEATLPPPRSLMVDSWTMTEPWEQPASMTSQESEETVRPERPLAIDTKTIPMLVDSSTQYTPTRPSVGANGELPTFPTPPKTIWDESASAWPGQVSAKEEPGSTKAVQVQLDVSAIQAVETAPVAPVFPELKLSTIVTQETEPVAFKLPEPEPVAVIEPEPTKAAVPELSVSPIYSEETIPVAFKLSESEPEPEPAAVIERETPEKVSPQLSLSSIQAEQTQPVVQPVHDDLQHSAPELSISPIQSAETIPVEPVLPTPVPAVSVSPADESLERPTTAVHRGDVAVSVPDKKPCTVAVEDAGQDIASDAENKAGETTSVPLSVAPPETKKKDLIPGTDKGAQTILSAQQIDQLLLERAAARPVTPANAKALVNGETAVNSPGATPKAKVQSLSAAPTPSAQPTVRRPGSAASQASHPPLPADHKQVIAAAAAASQTTPGSMGPPLAPASAYRTNARPRTPNDHASQHSKDASTQARARGESQTSRRSSLSSFASELDERFNIRSDGVPHSLSSDTDPRMIQAITQTMIGEYLWKYTRKAVSGEMSNTRHRRYFWVHPYTRTLYWSDHDPQLAGKSELKAKSVPIEAIRVIADDNPYPPGLHRKSLEVVSPGRRIRFTATTSQRHETWFNALSYLLLRTNSDDSDDHDLTAEDVDEFNPTYRSNSRQTTQRHSLSSYNSRTTNTSKNRAASALSVRPAVTPGRVSPSPSAQQNSTLRASENARQSSTSRLSSVLTATIRGSFSSLRGRHTPVQTDSIYDPSLMDHDSAEDLRQVIERQEREADRLENVRACCDGEKLSHPVFFFVCCTDKRLGKHDVGSLSRTSRYSPGVKRFSHPHVHH